MLKRKVYQELLKWKENTEGKALCIIGARQIGKTTLIREFGKNEYEHFAEINFVTDEKAADIFNDRLTAEVIITNLTAYLQTPLEPGKTLILFDEVQECPAVRSAIKFLVEDGRFDYIESGSLLGVRYKEVRSYPVGFEQIVPMYPLDFEEYLWANGVQDKTLQYLKNCYDRRERVSDSVHETLCKLFYSYLVVGGMPETVQIYIDTHDIAKVVQNQRSILELYRLDIAKYAEGSDKAKIKAIFDSIPAQLNEKNRRFKLNSINASARHIRYEDSFNWLADAGVALPCYNVTEPQAPLQLSEKRNLFKLYMNDVGLLCASCMENIQFDLLMGNVEINMGSILENAFAQCARSSTCFRLSVSSVATSQAAAGQVTRKTAPYAAFVFRKVSKSPISFRSQSTHRPPKLRSVSTMRTSPTNKALLTWRNISRAKAKNMPQNFGTIPSLFIKSALTTL